MYVCLKELYLKKEAFVVIHLSQLIARINRWKKKLIEIYRN